MSSLFGGSKSTSSSSNKAFDYIKGAYAPQVAQGGQASNALAGLLGVGGDPAAAQAGFQNYIGSTGYQFQLGEGQDAITNNAATTGLLNSGATLKATQKFGQQLAGNYFQQYLSQLGGLSELGQGAGSIIAGAGGTSTSTSKTKPNIFGSLMPQGLFGGG